MFGSRHTMCATAVVQLVCRPSYNAYHGRRTTTITTEQRNRYDKIQTRKAVKRIFKPKTT